MNKVYMFIFMAYKMKNFLVYKTKSLCWRVKTFATLNYSECSLVFYFLILLSIVLLSMNHYTQE